MGKSPGGFGTGGNGDTSCQEGFLSSDKIQRLLTACEKSRNPHLYLLVLLAISTGARYGEVLNLRWVDC